MSIISGLRAWLKTCPLLESERLHVDFLPMEAQSYALEVVPCAEIVKRYLDGSAVKQFAFVISSRNFHSVEIAQNIDNLAFYEDLSAWCAKQCRHRAFPDLGVGRQVLRVETTSSAYLFDADEHDVARYQIQCKLQYIEKRSKKYETV